MQQLGANCRGILFLEVWMFSPAIPISSRICEALEVLTRMITHYVYFLNNGNRRMETMGRLHFLFLLWGANFLWPLPTGRVFVVQRKAQYLEKHRGSEDYLHDLGGCCQHGRPKYSGRCQTCVLVEAGGDFTFGTCCNIGILCPGFPGSREYRGYFPVHRNNHGMPTAGAQKDPSASHNFSAGSLHALAQWILAAIFEYTK